MNAKKILKQAIKSVPANYVCDDARIWIKGADRGITGKYAVLVTHTTLETIIWTEDFGWEKLHDTT